MCDDFLDDMDGFEDSMFDPSNDFEEDIAGEYFSYDEEGIYEEQVDSLNDQGKEEQHFDILDAMIVGSMIAGNAYEEAEDEKKRRQSEKKI